MKHTGIYGAADGAHLFGFRDLTAVHWNLTAPRLYAEALVRGEARIADGGALVAETGAHTGRSPNDKFVVRDASTENHVWWDNNGAISPAEFETLLGDFLEHAKGRDLFVQDLYAAADPSARVNARVFTEFAWHSLFIRNLLIRPRTSELASFAPDLTIVDLPSFRADPNRHGVPHRNGDRVRFYPQHRADRRHPLRRRDEEVGVHLSQLRAARRPA